MPGNTPGNTWSHNSHKKAVGVFTTNIRRQGLIWRKLSYNAAHSGNVFWAYGSKVKYNPRHLPVVVEGRNGFNSEEP